MKYNKILLFVLLAFSALTVNAQTILTLTEEQGTTVLVSVADIQYVAEEGTGSMLILDGRRNRIQVQEPITTILANSCESFLDVTDGTRQLIHKNYVRTISQKGTGAKIDMTSGRSVTTTTTLWATVLAQASTPVGCGGAGGTSNLSYTSSTTVGTVNNTNGTGFVIPQAGGTGGANVAGLLTPSDKDKLDELPQNITEGTLDAATAARSVPMGNQDLTFANLGELTAKATATYFNEAMIKDSDADFDEITIHPTSGLLVRKDGAVDDILGGAGDPVDGTTKAWQQYQMYVNTSDNSLWTATTPSSDPDISALGSVWTKTSSAGSTIVRETVNGGRFTYEVLSGTPVLTYDKTTPTLPTLTVAGGTIRLIEVRDFIVTATNVNPTFTFNATWDDALDAPPSSVTKFVTSSGQIDNDNTPQVLSASASATQSVIQVNGVATNYTFNFVWNN